MDEPDYPLSCEDVEEDGPWFKAPRISSSPSPQPNVHPHKEETWWP